MQMALVIILILSSLSLITAVLMQSGRSAGLSGSISGASEAMFGKKKGMDELFGKLTGVIAAIFLLSALGLAIIAK